MASDAAPFSWAQFVRGLRAVGEWFLAHEAEIRAFAAWGTVSQACSDAKLYAPRDSKAWSRIVHLMTDADDSNPDVEALILGLYAPDGVGFDALVRELKDAPLLGDRQREIISSLVDGPWYVRVCGTLPLIEYVRCSGRFGGEGHRGSVMMISAQQR